MTRQSNQTLAWLLYNHKAQVRVVQRPVFAEQHVKHARSKVDGPHPAVL